MYVNKYIPSDDKMEIWHHATKLHQASTKLCDDAMTKLLGITCSFRKTLLMAIGYSSYSLR